jgi:GTPase SAR1 family protein
MSRTLHSRIVLWGPPSAGKTALLGQLFVSGRSGDATNGQAWLVRPTAASKPFFETVWLEMSERNNFPQATTIAGQDVSFDLLRPAKNQRATFLIHDHAGAQYVSPEGEVLTSLCEADSIILLFDYTQGIQKLEREVITTLNRIQLARNTGEADARPIAFCLSKADLYIRSPEDLDRAISAPDEFVTDHCEDMVQRIATYCSNYKLFPLSASGVRPRYGSVEPASICDDFLRHRFISGGSPVNLFEPLDWIFSRLNP